jgi:phosphatidylethanolamine/phosphatidyl-N-methylethanolamine N-methyltransferase
MAETAPIPAPCETVGMTRWSESRWNLYAPLYDALDRPTRAARSRSLGLLDLHEGERVLVAGCGTGLDLCLLPRRGLTVVGVDASSRMLDRAAARSLRLGVQAELRLMDATRLDFADAEFDAVVLHLILAVVPDAPAVMREAARVLRPGGRACVFDKFVPDDREPGVLRRGLDVATRLFATSITRQLGDLVDPAQFVVERDEPSLLHGQFRVALLRRV